MAKWIKTLSFLFFLLLGFSASARAHKSSDSYLVLRSEGERVEGQWDVSLRDLEYALGLDGDQDGAITWGELRSRQGAIADYLFGRLEIKGDGATCSIQPSGTLVDRHSDGAYAVLTFQALCPSAWKGLEIHYRSFFDLDPEHRGLVRFESEGGLKTAVLSPVKSIQTFSREDSPRERLFAFLAFVKEGVWHIWTGFDHLLFLIALLLPSVLRKREGRFEGVLNFKSAFFDVLKIVTAFTVAHSITLSLASLRVVSLPSRWVESAIALSIAAAAVNNFYPLFGGRRALIAFGFGLIHGFGFAGVLRDLGLPPSSLISSLLAFNGGVELGQGAVVAAFLPFAYWLRRGWFYQRLALVGGSCLVVGVATLWFVERFFNLELPII